MARTLYLNNDFDVLLRSAALASDGTAITSATVTWALLDENGSQLGTGTCTYNATNGEYAGVIESSVFASQAVGANLTLRIRLVSIGLDAEWLDRRCTVRERPFEV